jgi:hypothetical protein
MISPSHLHFRTMSPEARHSALQRLAWRGFDPRMISEQTGLPEVEVRRAIEAHASPSPAQPMESASFIDRFRNRQRRH